MNELIPSLYDFSAHLLDGTLTSFSRYRGQVLLIVNTASRCGFTPQYEALEQLYRRYRDRGFSVLGFPSNQFGRQEPGTSDEIASFCQLNYGVSFPVFAKIEVNGPNTHPLYRYLKTQQPGSFRWLLKGRIRWNFNKFLVDRSGRPMARYGSTTRPEALDGTIHQLLC